MTLFGGQSFMGVPFSVEQQGGMVPMPTKDSFTNTRHVPWSDRTIIELGGIGVHRLVCKVWVDLTNKTAFEGKLQDTGVLVYLGLTHATSTLLRIDNRQMLIEEQGFTAECEWIVSG